MNTYIYQPSHPRAIKARTAAYLDRRLLGALGFLSLAAFATGLLGVILGQHLGFTLAGLGLMGWQFATWLRGDLLDLPPAPFANTTQLAEVLPANTLNAYRTDLTPAQIFAIAATTWDGRFVLSRLELAYDDCMAALAGWQTPHQDIWTKAVEIAQGAGQSSLNNASILAACFHLKPELEAVLTTHELSLQDLTATVQWSIRLNEIIHAKKPLYGGFARDWAAGFTPLLARFGHNLSSQVEFSGKYYRLNERTTQLDTLVESLNGATGSVVLVGEPGVGKSALLLGLADRILQGVASGRLAHHQIISLDASRIIAETSGGGVNIEEIVLNLIAEANHAGNILLALDEAQLFFGQGTGAVNLSQVLLPVLQSRNLSVVLAVTPGDWQRLRATNAALASLLTPLVLSEPDEAATISVLADRALLMETAGATITYHALVAAYRLSGRYLQDEAHPGKSLKVLEAALAHPDAGRIGAHAVEQAIEAQFGVKVATASAAESDILLHLEDKIHERMINQTRAVGVVSAALRRARAGVSNPRRPIGSFLFLGPTGVGKTELAKSLAALYFGDESSIIRLDMSEYQTTTDVDRLLQDAARNPEALLPKIRSTPFSVVLFDEIEKANPNILNLFLQLLDEGELTDLAGHPASFKDSIIIATSNAGAAEIRDRIQAGEALEDFEAKFVDDLINSGSFKPELLNRFDEIVLFRPLNQSELEQVVGLMVTEVNRTLEPKKITVKLAPELIKQLVAEGYDPRLGARPMRRMVTRRVEDQIAQMILEGTAKPGDTITLDVAPS